MSTWERRNLPKVDQRVELVALGGDEKWSTLPIGTKGTIVYVDDRATVHVKWDNGSTLGLCHDAGDRFKLIQEDQ